MKKRINIPLYLTALILFSFLFKVAIADYIKADNKDKSQQQTSWR